MKYPESYYKQIEHSIELLQTQVEHEDLTPFESYCTAIGELNGDSVNYQLQMRIVRMESKLSMEENAFRKEEITKFNP